MTNWTAAYNRLYPLLDNYTGSQFIRIVQETDPDLLSYKDYIGKRQQEDKSTTKRDYFKDIILSYDDDIKMHLFEVFLEKSEESNPAIVKEIRAILKGEKIVIKPISVRVASKKELDETLLDETLDGLGAFPDAKKLYDEALKAFRSGRTERHILDDLRLSIEHFLRTLLKNNKTLENQIAFLGQYQKAKGISPEITNMFQKLIDLFAQYQNTYVKHHDKVKPSEIEFIFNLTNTFYRFLLSH